MIETLIVTGLAMLLDVLTGVLGAIKTGDLKSGKMREGLWHKAGFVGLIAMAFLLEYAAVHIPVAGIDIPAFVDLCNFVATVPLVLAVCVFVLVTEAVSIIENLCVLNPAIKDSPIGQLFANEGKEQQ